MPLFMSDEELRLLGGDVAAVAERADAAIRELRKQVDTVRAEADAAAIAAEQTCALLEQRFATLSTEFDRSQAEATELAAASERHAAELATSQAEIHQLRIQAIAKDGEVERLKVEISELHKSKSQSLELIEQRDAEIREKDGIIQSYHDKILNLADSCAGKEARIQESDAKLTHCQATCNRIAQEKELLEKHNLWLDEELKAKVKNLAELRKANMDEEGRMSAKIAELERDISESSSSLRRSKERISELEQRVSYMEKELCSTKDSAAANEHRLGAQLSTVMKLAELHKESSEEWSKKAGELEGVIKALEAHLTQVEDEYKEKLEKETIAKRDLEKAAADLKQKLEKCESDLENTRKSSELSLIPLTSIAADSSGLADIPSKEMPLSDAVNHNDLMIVPKVPSGVSGTALAASLLRDGWSLAKIYEKYQEATDALRHERWGRRHAEAVLERVLHEIEEKAELILDERAEHERMVEAYALMDHKLQQALLEHDNFENTIRNLKSELKRWERDHNIAQKEIDDLQKQVAVLLKECQDIQLRCGSSLPHVGHGVLSTSISNVMSNVGNNSNEHMTFNDINGLVQQNVQLRNKVHLLSADLDKRDMELRENFQIELKRITDDAASRVEKVMKKSEEQAIMIESLHRSVAMYRKLCEEQQKTRSNVEPISNNLQDDGRKDLMVLFEGSQEVSKKAYEQVSERARSLDEELTKLRTELVSLQSERDKAVLEADFARDRLNGFAAELEHQRKEANSVSLRNAELMHLVVDYEKRLRESSDSMQVLEDNSRKLSMEVSILKHEKEILVKSEKKALDEVHDLTKRVHRLQATIDTIHTTEEVQENARAVERRNQEDYIKRLERDWAELKKELQEQRDHVRVLTLDKKNAFDSCMKQVEDMRKELQSSWKCGSSGRSRSADHSVYFAREEDLVCIEKNKHMLMHWLTGDFEQGIKIATIWGMGGVGKTTLVSQMFKTAKMGFDISAWVTVSPSYQVEDLLEKIARGFGIPIDVANSEKRSLVEIIHNYLQGKSYLVILDDVWHVDVWFKIRNVFPTESIGRFAITTRIQEVALLATKNCTLELAPLEEQHAWQLFCNEAFWNKENKTCPEGLRNLAQMFVDKCGGMPIAIACIGRLLSCKHPTYSEWENVYKELELQLTNNAILDVNIVLKVSLENLPHDLKNCFLHCTIFPEYYSFGRKRLIRHWIAAGFIKETGSKTVEEVAEGYLNELVNRSLLQVAERNLSGRVKKCRMHDIIRFLALAKSNEECFCQVYNGSGTFSTENTRRLSIQSTSIEQLSAPGLRSLYFFRGDLRTDSLEAFLKSFKLLSTLDLQGVLIKRLPKVVFNLFNLRFLGLRETHIEYLPKEIGRLQNLEVLDAGNAKLLALPVEVVTLRKLKCLYVVIIPEEAHDRVMTFHGIRVPDGIRNLTDLVSLQFIEANSEILWHFGCLTKLRTFGITKVRSEHCADLCCAITKMVHLVHVAIVAIDQKEVLQLEALCFPPTISKVDLAGQLDKKFVSQFISASSKLINFTQLILCFSKLDEDSFHCFLGLNSLVMLYLNKAYEGKELHFDATSLPKLKLLQIWDAPSLNKVAIEQGAMQNLIDLLLRDCPELKDLPDGIEHLGTLEYLHLQEISNELGKKLRQKGESHEHNEDWMKISHIKWVKII